MWLSDAQKIGVGLTSFGGLFMVLGVLLLFDSGLLAIGNLFFLAGITLLIGLQKTLGFFAQRNKLGGTVCFLGGIFLVLVKWPMVGMIIELFGFVNLFGDFFPVVLSFLRKLPLIGRLWNLPIFSRAY
ncbi:Got1-domain-containing protein [Basidiobolus meristosporus CBS 931.73]|uniref:Got1-domain-containing protein n=1 Tax=Basidiobolus meristosporus CBS 931.73 TaxID=1314790 RepID=A0A1Y1XTC2_9FUNG|nr:Got1-domain-containing protein [Basidiobolus meristosporus CBS 931.73]|eukprot:ORX88978.1 Got1-domain-containing protein [Basidiobolus meristosporus CBS 931.73]